MSWLLQSKRWLSFGIRRGIDLIFPPQCACCSRELEEDESADELCRDCREDLVPSEWNACFRCGGLVSPRDLSSEFCPYCRKTRLEFRAVTALGGYHSRLKHVILRTKQPYQESLAMALGKLVVTERRDFFEQYRPELIVPIPQHWTHRLSRRFNSPDFFAHAIGKAIEIPVNRRVLVRCRKTQTQSELNPRQRVRNVRGAFRVSRSGPIRNRRVLLVDDVLTTGATCNEAAKTLLSAGAELVIVAVIARAQGENR